MLSVGYPGAPAMSYGSKRFGKRYFWSFVRFAILADLTMCSPMSLESRRKPSLTLLRLRRVSTQRKTDINLLHLVCFSIQIESRELNSRRDVPEGTGLPKAGQERSCLTSGGTCSKSTMRTGMQTSHAGVRCKPQNGTCQQWTGLSSVLKSTQKSHFSSCFFSMYVLVPIIVVWGSTRQRIYWQDAVSLQWYVVQSQSHTSDLNLAFLQGYQDTKG